jgi:hypothetical protein
MERRRCVPAEPSAPGKLLGQEPLVHPGAAVRDGRLGARTEVGPGWSVFEVDFGDYSYAAGSDGVIHHARVGRSRPRGGSGTAPHSRRAGWSCAM